MNGTYLEWHVSISLIATSVINSVNLMNNTVCVDRKMNNNSVNAPAPHSQTLTSGMKGRDHYNATYKQDLEREAEWLRRSATGKADSVACLLRRNGIKPKRILELGCGTGAVLSELKRRKVAEQYYGVDYSDEAIAYLSRYDPDVHCAVTDITENTYPFKDIDYFDVIIISHTIEHLEEPIPFLRAVNRMKFGYLVAEVPLEDLLLGKLKAMVKDRADNPAGHVQFFHRTSFRGLLRKADFEIVDEYLYPPVLDKSTLRFAYQEMPGRVQFQKLLTEHALPILLKPVWARLYHGHFAVLCRK